MLRINRQIGYYRPRDKRSSVFKQETGVKLSQLLKDREDQEMELCVREQLIGELLAYGRASFTNHWDGGSIETVYVVDR